MDGASIFDNMLFDDFFNYFGFWSFKFFGTNQILSSENLKDILNLTRKHRLVNKCKNTNAKSRPFQAFFCIKVNTCFLYAQKLIFNIYIYILYIYI